MTSNSCEGVPVSATGPSSSLSEQIVRSVEDDLAIQNLLHGPPPASEEDCLKAFEFALKSSKFTYVQQLLQHGIDPMALLQCGSFPIQVAAEAPPDEAHSQAPEIINLLVTQYGCDVNALDKRGSTTPLMRACAVGNRGVVQLLIALGADVNIDNLEGWRALISACDGGHADVVEQLIAHGAEVNFITKKKDGWTPLMKACRKGDVECVNTLLNNGADWTLTPQNGWGALLQACFSESIECVRLLLVHGALVNAATDPENGISPLMEVAARGNVELARLLIDAGADVNWRNRRNGWGAVLEVCAKNKLECLKLLLEANAQVDCWTNPATGVTPLIEACSRGHVECARMLLEVGADPDARNTDNGWSAMMEACAKGQTESVQLLIDYGADVDSVTKQPNGDSPLMTACGKGHAACAQLLVQAGASVDRGSNDGWRPVISACDNDKPECLQLLIDAGAEVNFFTNPETGFTPLMKACSKGSPECVRILLNAGANVDAGNLKTGWRAVMNCVKDHPKAKNGLTDDDESIAGSELDVDADDGGLCGLGNNAIAPNRICDAGKLECLRLLIAAGSDLSFQTENLDGWCPLMRACREGIPECVRVLLAGGADPNAYNRASGMTVLMEACSVPGNIGAICVQALVEDRDTKIDAISKRTNKTALAVACEKGLAEASAVLVRSGADTSIGASKGLSPLQLACTKGHEVVVRMLLDVGVDARQAMDIKGYSSKVPKTIQTMLTGHVTAKCGADADAAAAELLRELEEEEEQQVAKAQKRKRKRDKRKAKSKDTKPVDMSPTNGTNGSPQLNGKPNGNTPPLPTKSGIVKDNRNGTADRKDSGKHVDTNAPVKGRSGPSDLSSTNNMNISRDSGRPQMSQAEPTMSSGNTRVTSSKPHHSSRSTVSTNGSRYATEERLHPLPQQQPARQPSSAPTTTSSSRAVQVSSSHSRSSATSGQVSGGAQKRSQRRASGTNRNARPNSSNAAVSTSHSTHQRRNRLQVNASHASSNNVSEVAVSPYKAALFGAHNNNRSQQPSSHHTDSQAMNTVGKHAETQSNPRRHVSSAVSGASATGGQESRKRNVAQRRSTSDLASSTNLLNEDVGSIKQNLQNLNISASSSLPESSPLLNEMRSARQNESPKNPLVQPAEVSSSNEGTKDDAPAGSTSSFNVFGSGLNSPYLFGLFGSTNDEEKPSSSRPLREPSSNTDTTANGISDAWSLGIMNTTTSTTATTPGEFDNAFGLGMPMSLGSATGGFNVDLSYGSGSSHDGSAALGGVAFDGMPQFGDFGPSLGVQFNSDPTSSSQDGAASSGGGYISMDVHERLFGMSSASAQQSQRRSRD